MATAVTLYQLAQDMRSVPFDISEVEKEISQLCTILRTLHDNQLGLPTNKRKSVYSVTGGRISAVSSSSQKPEKDERIRDENERNLWALLLSCEEILQAIAALLNKYNTLEKARFDRHVARLSWILDGQRKLEKLRKRLEARKWTLNIAVGLII